MRFQACCGPPSKIMPELAGPKVSIIYRFQCTINIVLKLKRDTYIRTHMCIKLVVMVTILLYL